MTEAEAKTKWCPFTFASPRPTAEQLLDEVLESRRCAGSACMAFRTRLGGQPENGIYQREVWCGLAGKPGEEA